MLGVTGAAGVPRADTEPNLSRVCLPLQHHLLGTAVVGAELEWNSFLNPGPYQEYSVRWGCGESLGGEGTGALLGKGSSETS